MQVTSGGPRAFTAPHLLLCAPPVPLQHLLQLRLLLVKLGDLLSVEVQQLAGRAQVSQSLVDGGKRGVRVFSRSPDVGSERKTF